MVGLQLKGGGAVVRLARVVGRRTAWLERARPGAVLGLVKLPLLQALFIVGVLVKEEPLPLNLLALIPLMALAATLGNFDLAVSG